MGYTKEKKVRLFLEQDGKCEYCGCDMILCFDNKFSSYDNLATFDHLYNRDHELRHHNNGEKRIFIVCRKCNNAKARQEPNNQQPNGLKKSIKKIVPKERWSDEKFMERINLVVAEEIEYSTGISKIDKQMNHLKHEKNVLVNKLSNKVKYKNLLLKHREENLPLNDQNDKRSRGGIEILQLP